MGGLNPVACALLPETSCQESNPLPDSRLNPLFITLEVARQVATENTTAACLQLITALPHELCLTEKLVVPFEGSVTEDSGCLAPSLTQMPATPARIRADRVDLSGSATNPAAE